MEKKQIIMFIAALLQAQPVMDTSHNKGIG